MIFSKWFNRQEPTHLTEQQVIDLARAAAGHMPMGDLLGVITKHPKEGNGVWYVSSCTKGRALVVTVDDLTGKIIDTLEVGVR